MRRLSSTRMELSESCSAEEIWKRNLKNNKLCHPGVKFCWIPISHRALNQDFLLSTWRIWLSPQTTGIVCIVASVFHFHLPTCLQLFDVFPHVLCQVIWFRISGFSFLWSASAWRCSLHGMGVRVGFSLFFKDSAPLETRGSDLQNIELFGAAEGGGSALLAEAKLIYLCINRG